MASASRSKGGLPLKQEFKSESTQDPLGGLGTFLSSYHIGDFAGILGLLITGFAAYQAYSAKEAAKAAADAAIAQRDKIEVASRLTDLSNRLKVARDVYNSDDWGRLDHLQDEIVSISQKIQAAEKNSPLTDLMNEIRVFARKGPNDFKHLKDEETISKMKRKQARAAADWADKVDAEKSRKVKNGA